jgi:hypothetical protein
MDIKTFLKELLAALADIDFVEDIDLRARTKITSHFKRRCIPPGCVAKAWNIPIFLRLRALSDGRLNT